MHRRSRRNARGSHLDDALVVCGRHVGTNDLLMNPLRIGLGDRLAGVFDETTPTKTLETVFAGVERVQKEGADAIVAVGGGSSLDIAKGVSMMVNTDRSYEETHTEIVQTSTVTLPGAEKSLLPLFAVPTTLAGADLSVAAGLVASTDDGQVEAIPVDNRFMPTALFYDPNLFDTTPTDILAGSAINGLDMLC